MVVNKNSQIRVIWEGDESEYNSTLKKEIKDYLSSNLQIPKNKIEVKNTQKLKRDKKLSEIITGNISNKDKFKNECEKYLKFKYPNYDIQRFFSLDEKINIDMGDRFDNFFNKNRKWSIKYIKGKNILSFGEFFHRYSDYVGNINLVQSDPPNGAGKTNFVFILKFLLYGNIVKMSENSRTYRDYFNDYVVDFDNEANIQGSFIVDGVEYIVRRELKLKKSDNVSHNLFLYRLANQSDKKILIHDGVKVVNLCKDNTTQTQKEIEKLVGSYEDFVFSSYYNSSNLEKWIYTKATERSKRLFESLGAGFMEEKYKLCYKRQKEFRKRSLTNVYSETELKNQIKDLRISIKSLKEDKKETLEFLNIHNKKLKILKEGESDLYSQKLSAPNWVEKFNLEHSLKNLKKYENGVDTLRKELKDIVDKLDPSFQNLEEIKSFKKIETQKIKSFREDIKNVKVDQSLLEQKNLILKELQNYDSNFKTKYDDTILKQKEKCKNLKNQIILNEDRLVNKKKELNSLKEDYICEHCNIKIIDNKDIKNSLNSEIISIESVISNLENSLKKNTKELEGLKKEKNDYIKIKKQTTNLKLTYVNKEIEKDRGLQIDIINMDINVCQESIEKFDRKIALINEKNLLEYRINNGVLSIKNLKEKISEYKGYEEVIKLNKDIDEKISIQLDKINKVEGTIKNINSDIIKLNDEINIVEYKIEDLSNKLNKLISDKNEEIDYKVFLQVHGKDGIAKSMVQTIIPKINQYLKDLMHEKCNFYLSLENNNKGINFLFNKDGLKRKLFSASGYEKTACCLALHLVLTRVGNISVSNFIFLDEIFSAPDTSNLKTAYSIVEELLSVYDSVYLITHNEEIKPWTSSMILIEMDENTKLSKIT